MLIITDGQLQDLTDTVDSICAISDQAIPMSIVIVGVGEDDFSTMVRLDADDFALRTSCTDLVQFVHFRDCERGSNPENF